MLLLILKESGFEGNSDIYLKNLVNGQTIRLTEKNDIVSFNLKEPKYSINVQLYYKLKNRIIKFVKKIDFNILLKVKL